MREPTPSSARGRPDGSRPSSGPAPPEDPAAAARRWRRWSWALFALVATTTALIVLGALVRAHDAGLACPDWPRCFGVWLPEMDLKIAFEWGHRFLAGSIALVFLVVCAAVLRHPAGRRAAGLPLAVAALLLAVQIVLGGLTVLLALASWTVTAHLVTGNAFNATLLVAALSLRERADPRPRPVLPTAARRAVWAVAALLAVQMVLGGLVSSNYAGLACPEWPTCNGGDWFPSWRGAVGLHLLHRTHGYALAIAVAAAAVWTRRHAGVARPMRLALLVVLAQVGVGVANVVHGLPVEVTGLHSALAAALVLCITGALREAWLRPVGSDGTRRRVVVVGAGFGGLAVVRSLRDTPVDVLLVDRENYHAFLPLLYQVATSGLSAQDVTHPVRSILRRIPNARFRMADVAQIDLGGRALRTVDGARIPYDALVVSAGSTTEHFGNEGAANHAFSLHHVEEATALRNHVLTCLELAAETGDPREREALLGFVIVGGGPTGLELAGMLAELRRHVVPRDFPGLEAAMRVTLVEGDPRLLSAFPEPLQRRALEQIRELGVEVQLGLRVETVDADGATLENGALLRSRTVVWAAGVRGAALGAELAAERRRDGRVPVDASLRLHGHPEVAVIGDLARVEGAETLPQVAQTAIQQGKRVAANLGRELVGEPPLPFSFWNPGAMATIGRNRAVAWIFGLRISGRIAWLLWLLAHIVFLVGGRNRASVFLNWIYHYFSYDLGLRAIVGPRGRGRAGTETSGREDAA